MRNQLPVKRPLLLGAALSAAALAVPAIAADAASAATISLNAPCYVSGAGQPPQMTVTGSSFGPGDTVNIQGVGNGPAGDVFATTTADANGNISVQTDAPIAGIDVTAAPFSVTATDENFDTGVNTTTAPVSSDYARGGVQVPTKLEKFSKRVVYTMAGFTPGKQVYGHYLQHGKLKGTHAFGKAVGPCGTLSAKATIWPVATPHPKSNFKVQFDDASKYAKSSTPRYLLDFFVF